MSLGLIGISASQFPALQSNFITGIQAFACPSQASTACTVQVMNFASGVSARRRALAALANVTVVSQINSVASSFAAILGTLQTVSTTSGLAALLGALKGAGMSPCRPCRPADVQCLSAWQLWCVMLRRLLVLPQDCLRSPAFL